MKHYSEKFLQRRRFLAALPLLVSPFVVVLFWSLGGGTSPQANAATPSQGGLNLTLPEAHFDEDDSWDKFKLYEQAEQDSARFEEARESDPYFDLIAFNANNSTAAPEAEQDALISTFRQKNRTAQDPNEERINKKLDELYQELNAPTQAPVPTKIPEATSHADPQFTADVERLEKMMDLVSNRSEENPEWTEMQSVLDKILDIQHPERVVQQANVQQQRKNVQASMIQSSENNDVVNLLMPSTLPAGEKSAEWQIPGSSAGFYGLEDDEFVQQPQTKAISAVIHDTQELVAGAVVKMRLTEEVSINGKSLPKDQFVYGICAINGERLTIEISSLRVLQAIVPVSLSAYDLDGLPGVYIPGAMSRDAAKQASDEAMQNVQLMSLNPSLEAQAAAAGVEAAKGLLSKKAKLVKVTVKAGYQILLVDSQSSVSQKL